MMELEERLEALEKKLKVCEVKFDQVEKYMEHYEKWYVDLVTKANETVEEIRKFLSKHTAEDIKHIEQIINAVHGQ